MIDHNPDPGARIDSHKTESLSQQAVAPSVKSAGKKSKSMHDGIAVWCDCCSCEAEPYWVEIAQEMGMEQVSDYED